MFKLRKLLIVLIGLVLSTAGVTSQQAISQSNKKVSKVEVSKLNQLNKNNNWVKLGDIWKRLNSIDYNIEFDKKRKLVEELQKDGEKVPEYLNNLLKAGLITVKEKTALEAIIKDRISTMEPRTGLVTCYKPAPEGVTRMRASDDLEKQYDILEKMAKENKINKETFEKARENILSDLKITGKNNPDLNKIEADNQLIELMYLLSK